MKQYPDYELLRLELLAFSKYKEFDEEKEGINCPIAIQKLQKEKSKKGADKKYVVAFLISEGKIVKIFKERLDRFSIDLFNPYMDDKQTLRVVAYLFDTGIKQEDKAFKQFLGKVSSVDGFFVKTKNFVLEYKEFLTFGSIIFSTLILFFVYVGLEAYGIVPQKLTGIQEIYFLLLFTFLSMVAIVFLIYLFLPFLLPFLLTFWLIGYFGMNISLLAIVGLSIVVFILCFVLLALVYKYKPLSVHKFLQESKSFVPGLAASSSSVLLILIVAMIGLPTLSSIITHDNYKHIWKSNYGMVLDIYQKIYSGYPKILIDQSDNNKTYYLPFEGKRYYFVYDAEKVKERYFRDLNKTKLEQRLCKKKQLQDEFRSMYIINNPYIKPIYQTQRFSIKDKNITIEEFNMTKILSYEDINRSLCDSKMIRNK